MHLKQFMKKFIKEMQKIKKYQYTAEQQSCLGFTQEYTSTCNPNPNMAHAVSFYDVFLFTSLSVP